MADGKRKLTDDEGTFLALLIRVQPTTAYQIARVYEESPVSNFGTSAGKIYPLIRRLKAAGLLSARKVQDRRGTEMLRCTKSGEAAVRRWVLQTRPNHLLLEDPMRTKVQSFGLLSQEQRVAWIMEARGLLREKLAELERYGKEVDVPFKQYVHDNAVSSLRSRIDWLGRLLEGVANGDADKLAGEVETAGSVAG